MIKWSIIESKHSRDENEHYNWGIEELEADVPLIGS